ncbi:enoyl-CoA hydratase-related protein [Nocardia vaccinii]|uniref:enoyl-CoA hydratase-related protein n=1 Tax=Nocardia vaccinii TaxID=1822 RepID=UPI000833B5A1|nr:enoyl-CoA hydratase-related protein [Nocardia vaccinii]
MTENTDANSELVVERSGAVLIARLNRPEARNALNGNLIRGIGQAVMDAESDPDIRAIVLIGTGDRAFCAGMDLRAFAEGEGFGTDAATEAYGRLSKGQASVPVIGAANATAVGGGLELLLGCDLIVASSAAKFGFPEVKRGLFAAGGGTTVGTRIPLAIALELLLTGDFVSAARAYEVGLINAVAEPDEVLSTALALAERIAANAPLGLAASKELARLAVTDADKAEARLKTWQAKVFTSADAKEGARAFAEKRTPQWQGN